MPSPCSEGPEVVPDKRWDGSGGLKGARRTRGAIELFDLVTELDLLEDVIGPTEWSGLVVGAWLPPTPGLAGGGVKRNRRAAMAALPFPGPVADSAASHAA